MRVHLLVNLFRPDAVKAAVATVDLLEQKGVHVAADRESAAAVRLNAVTPEEFPVCDLVITFGGDGTLIRAAHMCAELGTPILGVYYGRFGFVTQCLPHEVGAAVSQFLDDNATIEERMMVQVDIVRGGKVVASLHSLNEAAVQRSATTRMLTFEVLVNGKLLSRYPADGVMVATPTGSTAYNLSAGGPVVDPSIEAMVIVAIMPHTLSARPLVIRPDAAIDIMIETRGDAVLSCDGQSRLHLLSGDAVKITRSPRRTRLVCVDDSDFYEKLAQRFQWSKGPKGIDA